MEGKPMNRETGVGRCQVSGQRAGTGSSRQGEVGEGGRGKHILTPVAVWQDYRMQVCMERGANCGPPQHSTTDVLF